MNIYSIFIALYESIFRWFYTQISKKKKKILAEINDIIEIYSETEIFSLPVGLHHCHSVAALFWLLLLGQSSRQSRHPLGGAAAVVASLREHV